MVPQSRDLSSSHLGKPTHQGLILNLFIVLVPGNAETNSVKPLENRLCLVATSVHGYHCRTSEKEHMC